MSEEISSGGDSGVANAAPAATPAAAPASSNDATATGQRAALASDAGVGADNAAQSTDAGDFTLPDEYKEKSWASKVKSQEDIYKLIENQESLIGKKTIKPLDYETATPEEMAAYHKSLAPEDLSAYKFSEDTMPELSAPMAEVFQSAGLNPKQAEMIVSKFDEVIAQIAGDKLAADTSEEGYFSLMEKSFGKDHKNVVSFVENNLRQYASNEDKAVFDAVDNNTRTAIDRTIYNILKAHGVEESGAQVNSGAGSPNATDIKAVQKDLRSQISALAARPHTAEEKQVLIDKLNATYQVK